MYTASNIFDGIEILAYLIISGTILLFLLTIIFGAIAMVRKFKGKKSSWEKTITFAGLTSLGIIFTILIWFLLWDLFLYPERYTERLNYFNQ